MTSTSHLQFQLLAPPTVPDRAHFGLMSILGYYTMINKGTREVDRRVGDHCLSRPISIRVKGSCIVVESNLTIE